MPPFAKMRATPPHLIDVVADRMNAGANPSAIRFLTGDTAIVISEGGIIFPGQEAVASEGLIRAS